jgi:hypothetical protein
VVAILGDVGEQREIAEGTHHRHRLLGRERIEDRRQALPRLAVLEAPARHRELADLLHEVESAFALERADRVAEEAAEEADVAGEGSVLVARVVHDFLHTLASHGCWSRGNPGGR